MMLAHKMLFLLFKLLQVNIKILGWLATGRAAAKCRTKSGPNSSPTKSKDISMPEDSTTNSHRDESNITTGSNGISKESRSFDMPSHESFDSN